MSRSVKVKAHTRVGKIPVREHIRSATGPHAHVGSKAYVKAAKTDLFQKSMTEHKTKQAKAKTDATNAAKAAAPKPGAASAKQEPKANTHKIEISVNHKVAK